MGTARRRRGERREVNLRGWHHIEPRSRLDQASRGRGRGGKACRPTDRAAGRPRGTASVDLGRAFPKVVPRGGAADGRDLTVRHCRCCVVPLPFVARTLRLAVCFSCRLRGQNTALASCFPTGSVAMALLLPCALELPSWLRHCLSLAVIRTRNWHLQGPRRPARVRTDP